MNTIQPMWPVDPASLPVPTLAIADRCESPEDGPHPHQPGSRFCCAHMPAEELHAFVAPGVTQALERLSLARETRLGQPGRPRRRSGTGQGGVKFLNNERRNGAQVKYPLGAGEFSVVCPTIYTPRSCYPYPNWRRKLGLAGSYPTAECQVVSLGWLPGQKPQKTT